MDWIANYGLFLAKSVTIVLAIAAVVIILVNASQRKKPRRGELRLSNLKEQYQQIQEDMQIARLDNHQQKLWHKEQKKKQKQEAKQAKTRAKQNDTNDVSQPTLFVLDFKGSMDAHEVNSLREEVTAVLSVVKPRDEVLLRLESPGGVVHGYGLAASQLQRLRDRRVPLTVAVDKVAASGGYMMACVADKIVAAPFAIIGSIGVVAQVPNFHRLLKRNNIDVELHTAGQYKRTLTLFGKNSEEGREKFREDLNETHLLFKQFVHQMRPTLDIDAVATGEHWYGLQALENGLIDKVSTSDSLLVSLMADREIVGVRYIQRKSMMERFTGNVVTQLDGLLLRWWQRGEKPLY